MKNFRFLFIAMACFLSGTGISFSQGDRCGSIQPFCAGTTEFVFQNSSRINGNVARAESGPDYGCLETQPYPAWFYLQIEEPGNLDFQIRQTVNPDGSGGLLDVDFIAWGPFQEDEAFCGNNSLTAQNTIGCSFLPSAVENFSINNASRGEIYVVLITNFSEAAGYISLQQTNTSDPSAGKTDCSIVNILGDDQKVCENEAVELIAENVIANRYEWYVFDGILGDFKLIPNESQDTYTVTETGLYKVITINENTGTELEDEVLIEFFDLPVASTPNDLQICDGENAAFFNLNSVRDELLEIYLNTGENFLLNFYASQANFESGSPISAPNAFEGEDEQKIIATITSSRSGCTSLPVEFRLQIDAPIPISIEEITAVCIDLNGNLAGSITIGEDLGSNYSYEWTPFNDPDGDGIQNAIYRIDQLPSEQNILVKITDLVTGCTAEFSTELKLFSPPLEVLVQIEGNDFENGFTVTGNAISGGGDETTYEYQLDNGSWQTDSEFNNVAPGNHTITAREINGCGNATSQQFRLIGYPRFFTPNSDGFNDTWNVVNDVGNSISKVFIFDRFGKLLKQLNPSSGGWDGNFNGKAMAADDYWFLIEYKDPNSGAIREYSGNFSLIR
ncbi:MAG: T9SS type B sorting domain-containing protein [Bacteroidota bacterium]